MIKRNNFISKHISIPTNNMSSILVLISIELETRLDYLFFLYNMRLSQPLSEDGLARYYVIASECGALLEDNPGVLNVTGFSNEARF
jgi:hypothetical protein